MGQGTYFTNNFNHEKAAWIDFERNEDADEFANETTICDLGNIITELGYEELNDEYSFENGLYKLTLEPKPDDEGVIFMLMPRHNEFDYYGKKDSRYTLAVANFVKAELHILKAVQKAGYKLRIAETGYTSKFLTV
jgi:hypothetical protein